jgi:hypothetical protein
VRFCREQSEVEKVDAAGRWMMPRIVVFSALQPLTSHQLRNRVPYTLINEKPGV